LLQITCMWEVRIVFPLGDVTHSVMGSMKNKLITKMSE